MEKIKISFGIIVVNGEPFIRYCLRSIYPFAYEIIVVEGAHIGARAVTTPDGHSVDETLEALYKFKKEEDPENKLQIITRQGYWPQKDELGRSRTPQSRAYAEQATGDYLWQIDIDEFYQPADMLTIIEMLSKDISLTAVSFMTHTFWGRPEYIADCWALRRGAAEYHRLFKWGSGYKYLTHQPPTVIDDQGRDLRSMKWVRGIYLARKGIYMYHYSLLFPWQVEQKAAIYKEQDPVGNAGIIEWAENNYFHLGSPYRVHNLYKSPSWLERFQGSHPPEVIRMMQDIADGVTQAEIRPTDDVEEMLHTWWYPIGRWGLKVGYFLNLRYYVLRLREHLGRLKRRLISTFAF